MSGAVLSFSCILETDSNIRWTFGLAKKNCWNFIFWIFFDVPSFDFFSHNLINCWLHTSTRSAHFPITTKKNFFWKKTTGLNNSAPSLDMWLFHVSHKQHVRQMRKKRQQRNFHRKRCQRQSVVPSKAKNRFRIVYITINAWIYKQKKNIQKKHQRSIVCVGHPCACYLCSPVCWARCAETCRRRTSRNHRPLHRSRLHTN